jgi:uroporphyrinogen-III synthase
MKLIITRPQEDCASIADALRERGRDVVLSPLIKITPRLNVEVPVLPYQAVCLTSANAARHLPLGVSRDLRVFTLGAQSASAAGAAGFVHVEAKGGNVVGLAANVIRALKPENGPLLYISGQETSGDLAGILRKDGFNVIRLVAYDAVPLQLALSAAEVATCNGVLLYSKRSAKIWVEEIERLHFFPQLSHFCLSAQVAQALPAQWPIRTAQEPTESSLLALIDIAAK